MEATAQASPKFQGQKKTALSWKMVEHNMCINDSTTVPKVGTVGRKRMLYISYRAPCSGAEDTSSVSSREERGGDGSGTPLLSSPLSPSAEEAMAVWRTFPCRRRVAASPTDPTRFKLSRFQAQTDGRRRQSELH